MLRPVLFLLVLTAVLPACRPAKDAEASAPLAHELRKREATKVRTAPIESREMVRRLSTTTTVESEKQIDVFPRVAGVVDQVHVEEGDRVEKDALLATLDQREARARLEDAKMALKEAEDQVARLDLAVEEALEQVKSAQLTHEQARNEFQRNEVAQLISEVDLGKLKLNRDTCERDRAAAKLAHRGAQQDLIKQQTTIERAELTVQREELALSFTEITAPFTGVVANRQVRVGDTVTSGATAFTLTDSDRLRCIVPRPQRELAFFTAARAEGGQVDIRIEPEAFPGTEYVGRIRILSPTIDPTSGSFRLTIELEQPPAGDPRPRLLPGMLVRLSIVTERHPDALVVPKRALRREGDRHFLYLDRDGVAEQVEVAEGLSDDENVEILMVGETNLVPGDPVVVVGNRDLEDGEDIEAEAWTSAEGDPVVEEARSEEEEAVAEESAGEKEVAAVGEDEAPGTDGEN
jgi:RND family efflux transporter MFP subunit